MKKKIHLPAVTLVTVTSVEVRHTLAALKYSMRGIDFGKVTFISHEKPIGLPPGVEFCRCSRITDKAAYSRFMIYDLDDYIKTPFCLTIQRDGFVVHPEQWRKEFLEYDYIGAPWSAGQVGADAEGNIIRVGNGGFSLRSKKLLGVARKAGIPFVPCKGSHNEDYLICCVNRKTYLEHGCRFAGVETARYFAHEYSVPEITGITPFGFHQHHDRNRRYPRFPSKLGISLAKRTAAIKKMFRRKKPATGNA